LLGVVSAWVLAVACCGWLRGAGLLAEWLRGLSVLGVFWAKRVRRLEVVSEDPPVLVLEWRRSRRRGRAFFALCVGDWRGCMGRLPGVGVDADMLLMTGSELPVGAYDRWSKVFVYSVDGSFLEPSRVVRVEVYGPGSVDAGVLSAARIVQESSWGFYRPPPQGDYVLLARLPGGEPVGVAYYNPASGNIDYGVHVSRPYWRRRIGTRLLVEAVGLARSLGRRCVSVVRVLRGVRPTASDRRAIAFYRANNPVRELNVYRLAAGGLRVFEAS